MRNGPKINTQYPRSDRWRKVPLPGGSPSINVPDYKGYEDRYDVSGQRRIALEVSSVAGAGDVIAGGTVNSVVYTYRAHGGVCITPGDT